MDPIATARYGLMAATRRFENAAQTVAQMGGDQPVDIEGATVDMIQSKHAFSANLSVISTSKDMWDALLDIQADR
jgi:flagellar hook-associated protein FlgK